MYPWLHLEIGVRNKVLDNFYDFNAEQVEQATPIQQTAQHKEIKAEVAWASLE
jgi:hypothetical protein